MTSPKAPAPRSSMTSKWSRPSGSDTLALFSPRVLTDGRLIHGWFVQGPFLKKEKGQFLKWFRVVRGPGPGPYWPIWAHMGPYRGPYGPYGAHMGPYGPIWALMGPKGPCMNQPSVDLPCSSTRKDISTDASGAGTSLGKPVFFQICWLFGGFGVYFQVCGIILRFLLPYF